MRVSACSSKPMLLPGSTAPLIRRSCAALAGRPKPTSQTASNPLHATRRNGLATLETALAIEVIGTLGQHCGGQGNRLRNHLLGHPQAGRVTGVIQRLRMLISHFPRLSQQVAHRLLSIVLTNQVGHRHLVVQLLAGVVVIDPAFPTGVAIARGDPAVVRLSPAPGSPRAMATPVGKAGS